MDSISKAADMLFGPDGIGAKNVRFSINPKVQVSADQAARQVIDVVEELKSGDYEIVD